MRITAISLCPMSAGQKARLEALGELRYHDAVLGDPGMGGLCRGAEALVITPRLSVDIVPFLDRCRFISVQGAGTDALNVAGAREKGIVVSNVPDFCTDAVAEHAFSLLLGVAKRIAAGPPMLHAGAWTTALAYTTVGLRGKTLGLLGCGKIGGRIAGIARGFGMDVVATVRDPSKTRAVPTVPFHALLEQSDFIVLAAPATERTTGMFNAAAFARMKPQAALINVSRAALVNTRRSAGGPGSRPARRGGHRCVRARAARPRRPLAASSEGPRQPARRLGHRGRLAALARPQHRECRSLRRRQAHQRRIVKAGVLKC